jgi:hypothetical protein
VDGYIGYYKPYAISDDELDSDKNCAMPREAW